MIWCNGRIRGGGSGEVQGVEEGDGEKRAEGEHGKDKGRGIWRGADDKNGEWEISMRVLWKRGGREFGVVRRMRKVVSSEMFGGERCA